MPIQPRIEEPSKPRPSLNVPSSQVSIGKEQCCQCPSMSTNFRSTISAWCFFAKMKTSVAFMGGLPEDHILSEPSRVSRQQSGTPKCHRQCMTGPSGRSASHQTGWTALAARLLENAVEIPLASNPRPMAMVTAYPTYAVRPAQNSEGWWTVREFRFEVLRVIRTTSLRN